MCEKTDENGLVYTGQAAQRIQDFWYAKNLSDKLQNIEEMYSCF